MSRRKQAALPTPTSQAEAAELCQDYVAAERRILELKLGYEVQIDRLKAERDAVTARLAAEQQGRFAALKAWWEAGGKALAGKRRSAELAGASIGIRLTPPAVKFARGVTAKAVLAWLRQRRAVNFFRTKYELDKQAIIKALNKDEAEAELFLAQGVTVDQVDEFYIDCGLDEAAIRQRLGAAEPNGLAAS